MYEDRNYLVIPVSELPKVDFTQIMESSEQTVRKSVDGTKTFIKWEGDPPEFISSIVGAEGPYTYTEILTILDGLEWSTPPKE